MRRPRPTEAGGPVEELGRYCKLAPVPVTASLPQLDWEVTTACFAVRDFEETDWPEIVFNVYMADFDYFKPLRRLKPLLDDALRNDLVDM